MELSPTRSSPTCRSLKKRMRPRTTSGWVQRPLGGRALESGIDFQQNPQPRRLLGKHPGDGVIGHLGYVAPLHHIDVRHAASSFSGSESFRLSSVTISWIRAGGAFVIRLTTTSTTAVTVKATKV